MRSREGKVFYVMAKVKSRRFSSLIPVMWVYFSKNYYRQYASRFQFNKFYLPFGGNLMGTF